MAKELPYYKFEPSEWDNGNIQLCTWEAKGVFVSLCSMYWQRLGDLPYKLAVQKICGGNATALDSLVEADVIKLIDGMICIDFLNEQLSEFENTSATNSKNARLGWEKRRNNATPMPPHSDPNAIRGEKIRGDEKEIANTSKAVFSLLKRTGNNTMDVTYMVRQWVEDGHSDILNQLKAMRAVYEHKGLVFPTKIETLTKSFGDADWVQQLTDLDPERKAERIQKTINDGKYRPAVDTVGSSSPGSLG